MSRQFVAVLSILAFVASIVLAQQQGQGAPPPPPFLEGAPEAKVQEFQQLLAGSGGKTDAQIDQAVHAWIGQQSEDIKTKFLAFEEEKKKMESAQDTAHKQAINGFSDAAKQADAQLSQIAADQSLTADEKGQKIQGLIQSLPQAVRDELDKAMQGWRTRADWTDGKIRKNTLEWRIDTYIIY